MKPLFFVEYFKALGNINNAILYEIYGTTSVYLSIGDVLLMQDGMSKLRIVKIMFYGKEIEEIHASNSCILTLEAIEHDKNLAFTINKVVFDE